MPVHREAPLRNTLAQATHKSTLHMRALTKIFDGVYFSTVHDSPYVSLDKMEKFIVAQKISTHNYSTISSTTWRRGGSEWDSDDDSLLPDNGDKTGYKRYKTFLGFHPYKEVIFLNDSKIQDLGYVYPEYELRWLEDQTVEVDATTMASPLKSPPDA
ncbi:hypothetical protein U9M48_009982 [Paspalum notatum var. saurae]|uniref:Uncharacterized protein n=1 Tax=Paspalum notatum var. saurae TaxID=547442 RepID=A0AAQ3SS46_PASNO